MKIAILIVFLFLVSSTYGQEQVMVLNLKQVVEIATGESPAASQASTVLKNRYWQFRSFRSNYMPRLVLNGTLPDYNRSISPVVQNDGTEIFRRRSLSSSSVDLALSQNVGLTGGEVFVSSQLQRIDIFGEQAGTSYLANPVMIGFNQPLMRFNPLAWDAKIEPLRYEESQKKFHGDMERVAMESAELYFNLLLAQINLEIATRNLSNTDTLYKISVGRYNLGKIAENELLQMELAVMNSKNNVAQGDIDVQIGQQRLKNFLNLERDVELKLVEPGEIPDFELNVDLAMEKALQNRQELVEFQRLQMEAERDVARAKGENGFNASLFTSYGLTQSAVLIDQAYHDPLGQQRLRLGFQVPVLDWGRARSQIKTAQANQDLRNITISQARQNFDQEIMLSVSQLKMHRKKLDIAIRSDTIAQRRYDITMQRYLIGKIGILDMNVALEERVQARRSYVQALRDFWISYYDIRRKTLYDFERMEEIRY